MISFLLMVFYFPDSFHLLVEEVTGIRRIISCFIESNYKLTQKLTISASNLVHLHSF